MIYYLQIINFHFLFINEETENDFFVKLNNRKLTQGLLIEIAGEEKLEQVMRIIDKKNKINEKELYEELKKLELTDLQINKIKDFLEADLKELKPKKYSISKQNKKLSTCKSL